MSWVRARTRADMKGTNIRMQVKVFTSILMFMKMRQQQKKLPRNWYFIKKFVENKKLISAWIVRRISIEFFISQPTKFDMEQAHFGIRNVKRRRIDACAQSSLYPTEIGKKYPHSHTETHRHRHGHCCRVKCLRAQNCFRSFNSWNTINVQPCRRLDVVSIGWENFLFKKGKNWSCQKKKNWLTELMIVPVPKQIKPLIDWKQMLKINGRSRLTWAFIWWIHADRLSAHDGSDWKVGGTFYH